MGYYMTVESQKLLANGLSELPEGLDELWRLEGEYVSLIDGYFKWDDWFERDLKRLAKTGVTGEVELSGEMAERYKYVLDGVVKLYHGAVTYPGSPVILADEGEEREDGCPSL